MLLTIGMMVKNEEKNLEECLQSLEPILESIESELVIVDTGSDDNTVEIAKRYTDKVYFHEWNNDFAEMRNIVIGYSVGDWYFSLDGDEILTNPQSIINFFTSGNYKNNKTALITIKNYTDKENKKYSEMLATRLFRNDSDFHYKGSIHEQPIFKSPITELDIVLDHYGYISADEDLMERKFIRTTTILKTELEKDPQNVYYWYQLSKSYAMHKDNKEALETIERAYKVAKENNIDLKRRMYVYTHLALMKTANNMAKETEKVCYESMRVKEGYIDIFYYLAWAKMQLGERKEAIKYYLKYLDIHDNFENSLSKKDIAVSANTISNVEIVYTNLVILYFNLDDNNQDKYANCIKFSRKIKDQKLFWKIKNKVAKAFIELNEPEALYKFYSKREDELKSIVCSGIEQALLSEDYGESTKNKIIKIFSKDEDPYGILNKVRLKLKSDNGDNQLNFEIREKIYSLKFNKLSNYYADIIYYLIQYDSVDIVYSILSNIKEVNLNIYIQYLKDKYDNMYNVLYKFIHSDKCNINFLSEIKVAKSFCRYLLSFAKVDDKEYKEIWQSYLSYGIKYMKLLYNKGVLNNQNIYELKNEEEIFLMYMYHAQREKNKKKHIQYLRKALDSYPPMKRGIEIILESIQSNFNDKTDEVKEQMNKTREKIENLIEQGKLDDAQILIGEYKNIIGYDKNVYSMESIIFLMAGNLNNAKNILLKGLIEYPNDFDLNYNLAYIYEEEKHYNKALDIYNKLINEAPNKKTEEEVKTKIKKYVEFTNM